MTTSNEQSGPRKGGRVEGLTDAQVEHVRQIARRIHQLIADAGYSSLNRLSAEANRRGQSHVFPGDLAKIVRGARSPTVKVLIRLAAVLDEDVFQLLVVPSKSARQKFIDRLRHAPQRTIDRLARVLDEENLPLK